MVTKNRMCRVSDSDNDRKFYYLKYGDEYIDISEDKLTKKEIIDLTVDYCVERVENNPHMDEFKVDIEENTDNWTDEDYDNKKPDWISVSAKRYKNKIDVRVVDMADGWKVLRDDERKRDDRNFNRRMKYRDKKFQQDMKAYDDFINEVLAYRQSNGQSSEIPDSANNKRMYRMNQVQDGLWDGIKRFFGGGNRQVESRDVETDYEQGDRIRFRRQNGQKATGIVENVYWNEDEQAVDYGVHSSITLDNVVVPEENVIGDSKDNNNMFKNRMYRVSDALDEPLPYTDEHPSTDWEYWGVHETTLKNVKPGDWFTLKPIPEPKESQVWIKGGYNRADRDYTCERYDGGGERFFKPDRKVYVDFYF